MKLYLKFFTIQVQSQMQYKISFFLTTIGLAFAPLSVYLGVYFILNQIQVIDGFTFNQIILCMSVVVIAFSIAECFARSLEQFPQMISNGEFDRILVRPRNEIFQVLASRMEFNRLGRFVQALAMLIYAVLTSGIIWSPDKIITLILMIICGSIIESGLFLISSAFTFFTIESLEFMNILTFGGQEFGRYPFSVYGEKVLKFLTYVVPLALFQYYPLLYLLGRSDNILYMFLPLIGTLFLLPCYAFWRFGLHRYKSTGS